jgi:predicted metalloprotease with PDZ domain
MNRPVSTALMKAISMVLLPSTTSLAHAAGGPAETVVYELRLSPREDRTDLLVDMQLERSNREAFTIGLPRDTAFGTRDLDQFVVQFDGSEGTRVEPGSSPAERMVHPAHAGPIRLRYTLSFDPSRFGDASFAPNVGPTHFHASCSQWMLVIGEPRVPQRHVIRWLDLPDGWDAYNSIGPDAHEAEVLASRRGLARAVVGAVRGPSHGFVTAEGAVSVYVADRFDIGKPEIVDATERIVRLQRRIFGEDGSTHLRVAVLPRPRNVAGVAVHNSFTCFVKHDVRLQQLTMLLAHEMLHSWMTDSKIAIGPEDQKSENFVRNQWFFEGVTDYVARRVLLDAGLLSTAAFAELVNRDLINLADNPYRQVSFDEMMTMANAGRFGTAHAKLSYYRGALIALTWEARLREAGSEATVIDVISGIYRRATQPASPLSYDEFFATCDSYGLDARGDFERWILAGRPIELPGNALGAGFDLVETEVPSFDAGFALSESVRRGEVRGVVLHGPAHRGGLRDGVTLVGIENGSRFSLAWGPDQPLSVVVRTDTGDEMVSFFPHGTPHRLRLFRPR